MADARDFHALKHLLGILEGELRQQDLIALCERHDSGRRIHLDAIEIDLLAGDLVGIGHNFADVDADAILYGYLLGLRKATGQILPLEGEHNRLRGSREDDEERIARR